MYAIKDYLNIYVLIIFSLSVTLFAAAYSQKHFKSGVIENK